MSTQPASVPSALSPPHSATSGPATGPIILAAASAKGALDAAISAAGASPKITTLAAIYMSAAMSTPASVAMGTLRSGSFTTAAATEALSRPVNAQNTSASEFGSALYRGSPLTFHDSRTCAASKAVQPIVTTSN